MEGEVDLGEYSPYGPAKWSPSGMSTADPARCFGRKKTSRARAAYGPPVTALADCLFAHGQRVDVIVV